MAARIESRRERELRDIASAEGFDVESVLPTSGGHVRLWLRGDRGRFTVICSATPSDWRAKKKIARDMRHQHQMDAGA